jgi:hypothetical protein
MGSRRRYDHVVEAATRRLFATYERLTNAGLAGDPDSVQLRGDDAVVFGWITGDEQAALHARGIT